MSKKDSLENRVKTLEDRLKKYAAISAIAGLLLGGGGAFGVAQWAYTAPLEKQVLKYESAMNSLNKAIEAAKDSGENEQVNSLRIELVALDRNYREALGLIEECMRVLKESKVFSNDTRTQLWLHNASLRLAQLITSTNTTEEAGSGSNDNT